MSAQKRIDFLKNQFSKVDRESFEKLIQADPTPEKKYSTWLLKLFSKSSLNLNDLPTVTEAISIHADLKQDIPEHLRDINRFDSVVSFLFTLNKWLVNRFNENEKNIEFLKAGGDLIFDNEDCTITKVLSYHGSVHFGSGTSWCTLKMDSYNSYAQQGYLYIFTPKNGKYTKYFGKKTQLHFGKHEFRNHDNTEINLTNIILNNPELYEPFKMIDGLQSDNKIYDFFFFEKLTPSDKINAVSTYGFSILSFLKEFSSDFINRLFMEYGEKAYKHVPESLEKTKSYVSHVQDGLKKLLIKGEEITHEIFKESVKTFPENILLLDYDDEDLWLEVLKKEAWLIKKSPFIKDAPKLLTAVKNNYGIIKYISPIKTFSIEQRIELAECLVDDSCENYLEYLRALGEFDEKAQEKLVKLNPHSVDYLVSASEKVKELSEKLITEKRKEEEEAEELARKRYYKKTNKFLGDYEYDKAESWVEIIDKYNTTGEWNIKDIVRIMETENGDRYYQTKDGRMHKTLDSVRRTMKNKYSSDCDGSFNDF